MPAFVEGKVPSTTSNRLFYSGYSTELSHSGKILLLRGKGWRRDRGCCGLRQTDPVEPIAIKDTAEHLRDKFLGLIVAKLAACGDVWISSHVRAGKIETNPLDLRCQRMLYTYGNTRNFVHSTGSRHQYSVKGGTPR